MRISVIRATACCACVPICLAAPLPIVNPGFEDISGEPVVNEFTFGPLNGWDLYDPGNVTDGGDGPTYYIGTLTPFEPDPIGNPGVYVNFPAGAPEGQRVAIAFNFAGSGGGGEYGLVQTLNEPFLPYTNYTLEVEIGNIASGTAMSGQFFDLDGFPGYRVDLLAGGQILDSDNNTLAGSIPEGEFATSSFTFSTDNTHLQLGQMLGVRLVNLNVVDPLFPGADLEVDFDDVRLSAEPVCPGDLTTAGAGAGDPAFGVPDGQITAADLQYYVNFYTACVLAQPGCDLGVADVTTQGAGMGDPGFGVPDGAVSAADLQFYVNLWVGGCP